MLAAVAAFALAANPTATDWVAWKAKYGKTYSHSQEVEALAKKLSLEGGGSRSGAASSPVKKAGSNRERQIFIFHVCRSLLGKASLQERLVPDGSERGAEAATTSLHDSFCRRNLLPR